MIAIAPERAGDGAAVEALLDRAFGPGRHRKTAQGLRDGQRPARSLALVARAGATVVGTVRFWPVRIGRRRRALLLGPVAVDAAYRNRGIGAALIRAGLARAKALGHRVVILIGDAPYYARFGFAARQTAAMELPGPVDRARFLALELVSGALTGAAGLVVADSAAASDLRSVAPSRAIRRAPAFATGDARVSRAA
jgi:predicted N-acetyltransferase YhbS